MTKVTPLSAKDIRALARKNARLLAFLLDTLPCGYELSYDDAAAVTARLLIDHGPLFCEMVCTGTGLSDAEVQSTPWPEVVKIGCEIVEVTRDAWRAAWPNGFLQAILCDELRPYSRFAREVSR